MFLSDSCLVNGNVLNAFYFQVLYEIKGFLFIKQKAERLTQRKYMHAAFQINKMFY